MPTTKKNKKNNLKKVKMTRFEKWDDLKKQGPEFNFSGSGQIF